MTLLAPPLTLERAEGRPKPDEQPFRMPGGQTKESFYCLAKQVLLEGPSRTSKTRTCLEKIFLAASKFPGARVLMLRKTRESMTQSVMQTFKEEVLVKDGRVRWVDKDQQWVFPNGSTVVVAGLDAPSKALSTGWDIIYINQAEELEADAGQEGNSAYETLLTRLSEQHLPFRQMILDCNPSYPTHWINRWFPPESDRPKDRGPGVDRVRLKSVHTDNPLLYDQKTGDWTAFGVEYMQTLDALTGYRRARLRDGLWVAAEGQFFEEWDPALHTCPRFEVPTSWPRWLAVDYGFAEPFCCLWAARDPDTRRIYIYREVYRSQLRDEEQAKLIREKSGDERIVRRVADPSMFNTRREQDKPSIARIYWRHGVRIVPALNKRIDGWQIVRAALANGTDLSPRLQILQGAAPNLCRAMPMMVCDPLDPEDLADKVKGHKTEDHAADTLRYLLAAESMPEPKPLRSIDFKVAV